MPVISLSDHGAEQFYALARRLKEADEKDLRRELYRGLNRAMKPLTAAVRQSAVDVLPRKGGLGAEIARSKMRTQRRTGTRSAGIKLIVTGTGAGSMGRERDIAALDRGRARHPLFGNRGHWYLQAVHPGWFSRPTDNSRPAVQEQLLIAMQDVADKIDRG
jgi:hypothetical protein